MKRHVILFAHADPSVRGLYEKQLSDLQEPYDLVFVNASGGYSSAYLALAEKLRDQEGRILPRLLAQFAPSWMIGQRYSTMTLVTFSAGYKLAEKLLAVPEDAAQVDCYIALDSIHSGLRSGDADKNQLRPFTQFAKKAKEGKCHFVLTHTDVRTPQKGAGAFASTTQCAAVILAEAGGTGGNFAIESFNDELDDRKEHIGALTSWGPRVVGQAVCWMIGSTPYRATVPDTERAPPPVVDEVPPWRDHRKTLRERCVLLSLEEMRNGVREDPPGSNSGPRIAEYFAPAYRASTGAYLRLTSGAWCAVAASWVAAHASLGGEAIPHPYVAAGIEIEEAAKINGCWIDVGDVRAKARSIERGDLVLFKRVGAEKWFRHVARVETAPDADGKFRTIGGNEGDCWRLTWHHVNDSDVLGFVDYSQPPPRIPKDAA